MTETALISLPRDGKKRELVQGELTVSPTGTAHGYVASKILVAISIHVSTPGLGIVLDSSTGFWMASGDCLSPDVSFIGAHRLEGLTQLPDGFFRGAPDLAVEVMSPSDQLSALEEKLQIYFTNGCLLAWIVNPLQRRAYSYSPDGSRTEIGSGEALAGGTLLPGLTIELRRLFWPPPAISQL
jgi:Uma2 family endonuclease